MKTRSVRMITKCLTLQHLKSINPHIESFVPGLQVNVFRSNGTIEHNWVVVESLGSEILVSRLVKEDMLVARAS